MNDHLVKMRSYDHDKELEWFYKINKQIDFQNGFQFSGVSKDNVKLSMNQIMFRAIGSDEISTVLY